MRNYSLFALASLCGLAFVGSASFASGADPANKGPLTLVVMDPLSKPLSCDCVKGYAQRDYNLLGRFLEQRLKRKVNVVWNASLVEARKETNGKADLVIGKHSVVLFDSKKLGESYRPVARLTGRDGGTTQKGLIVVRDEDAAKSVGDLGGYAVYFGPEEAEEKCGAAKKLLAKATVSLQSKECKTFNACSEAASALLKLSSDTKAAAVISSYAEPLLEGCGSIRKGDLRVVGSTEEVPFVTAFVNQKLDPDLQLQLQQTLLLSSVDAKLMMGLETLLGFVEWDESDEKGGTSAGATSSVKTSSSKKK